MSSNDFLDRHLDEFFSFYGFYQDVINELQDNCNYNGKFPSDQAGRLPQRLPG